MMGPGLFALASVSVGWPGNQQVPYNTCAAASVQRTACSPCTDRMSWMGRDLESLESPVCVQEGREKQHNVSVTALRGEGVSVFSARSFLVSPSGL